MFELFAGAALTTTGIKLSVTSPAGSTLQMDAAIAQQGSNPGLVNISTTSGGDIGNAAAAFGATSAAIRIRHWVLNGATPGSITFQFAQATSSGTAVTIKKGSFVQATRVA